MAVTPVPLSKSNRSGILHQLYAPHTHEGWRLEKEPAADSDGYVIDRLLAVGVAVSLCKRWRNRQCFMIDVLRRNTHTPELEEPITDNALNYIKADGPSTTQDEKKRERHRQRGWYRRRS